MIKDISMVTATNLLAILAIWVAYIVAHGLYNISPWHPLHRFPGPRLAAASLLYEFWYDMVLGGTYTARIKKMHAVYGTDVVSLAMFAQFPHSRQH